MSATRPRVFFVFILHAGKPVIYMRITCGDPMWGWLSIKSRVRCAYTGLFCYHPSPQRADGGLLSVIRFRGTFNQSLCPLRVHGSFVSILPLSRAGVRIKTKNPRHFVLRDWLRSVADSNRRKRFCRPLPSHSVNRPCTPRLF